MSKLTIYSLEGLLVPCFAAADQGIGFNDPIFFFQNQPVFEARFRACLHEGGGPQVGEVT